MNPSDIKEQIKKQLDVPYGVDLTNLNETMYIVDNITGLILGAIAYCIAVLLTLITALDIAYITIPIYRDRIQALRWDGTKSRHLRAVSRDAVAAVEEAETVKTGKSPLSLYLVKRAKTYIVSVFILALILGGMSYIKGIVMKVVLTFMKAF